MGFDRNASRRFAGLATLTVLVFGGPAAAQTFDHLASFKTKDSTKASATVDLAALQALYQKHRLAHGQRGDPEDITTVG